MHVILNMIYLSILVCIQPYTKASKYGTESSVRCWYGLGININFLYISYNFDGNDYNN